MTLTYSGRISGLWLLDDNVTTLQSIHVGDDGAGITRACGMSPPQTVFFL